MQVAGLTIHALDRIDVQRLAQARELAVRVISLYRTVVLTAPERREAVLRELHRVPGVTAELARRSTDLRAAGECRPDSGCCAST